ncbi:hypothetical protein [Streptomyces sp. NPDC092307]|uniref:hypothetical protein n=1 Tax=Streptomyces sp. NPDC092307 TaxID=3366013 RepID=UPI003824BE1E
MGSAAVLLTVGPAASLAGGWVALDIRGAARALEHRAASDAELMAHARGDLGPARRVASAALYRFAGTVIALCGIVLPLSGLLELA